MQQTSRCAEAVPTASPDSADCPHDQPEPPHCSRSGSGQVAKEPDIACSHYSSVLLFPVPCLLFPGYRCLRSRMAVRGYRRRAVADAETVGWQMSRHAGAVPIVSSGSANCRHDRPLCLRRLSSDSEQAVSDLDNCLRLTTAGPDHPHHAVVDVEPKTGNPFPPRQLNCGDHPDADCPKAVHSDFDREKLADPELARFDLQTQTHPAEQSPACVADNVRRLRSASDGRCGSRPPGAAFQTQREAREVLHSPPHDEVQFLPAV